MGTYATREEADKAIQERQKAFFEEQEAKKRQAEEHQKAMMPLAIAQLAFWAIIFGLGFYFWNKKK